MLNMVRMELFRLFRSKSFYVMWIVLIVIIAFSTYMLGYVENTYVEEERQEIYESSQEEPIILGIQTTYPSPPGEKVTVYDLFYSSVQGKAVAVIMAIFSVLYSISDISSGYVKNIAGQVKDRKKLVFAKAAALGVYTVCTMLFAIVIQALCNLLFLEYFVWGPAKDFLAYAGIQTLLHFALLLVVMCIAIILRSKAVSITISILLCMNTLTILYSFIDNVAQRFGIEDLRMVTYTLTGRIALLGTEITQKAAYSSIVAAVVFSAAAIGLASMVFKHRDV